MTARCVVRNLFALGATFAAAACGPDYHFNGDAARDASADLARESSLDASGAADALDARAAADVSVVPDAASDAGSAVDAVDAIVAVDAPTMADGTGTTDVTAPTDAPIAADVADANDAAMLADAGPCPGRTLCGSTCLDLQNDPMHCGGCAAAPCPTDPSSIGVAVCTAGVCGINCGPTAHWCGDHCADNTSVSMCGPTCAGCAPVTNATVACVANACQVTCNGALSYCPAGCVDLRTSRTNCGTCGTRCAIGCSAGTCQTPVAIDANGDGTCALATMNDGTFRAWGECTMNGTGALLPRVSAPALRPQPVPHLDGTGALPDLGRLFVCAVFPGATSAGNTVRCGGNNDQGQLGSGTNTASGTLDTVQESSGGNLTGALSVTTGRNFACAIMVSPDRSVVCWGDNWGGQLGNGGVGGTVSTANVSQPVGGASTPLTQVAEVAAADGFACARTAAGAVSCWGSNSGYALATSDPAVMSSPTPRPVTLPMTAIHIYAHGQTACAVLADNTARCWGSNANGRLGDGTTTDRATPVAVMGLGGAPALQPVTQMALSGEVTCAALSTGRVFCWGNNSFGEVGNGTAANMDYLTPQLVSGFGTARNVASAPSRSIIDAQSRTLCAITRDPATVVCWGDNMNGNLGNGGGSTYGPVEVSW